ncbi:MAG: hypothetical protein M3Y07_06940 [Acidobacteriota bacterium]|nr:hypothetical protein [Acidobacteriota bacterium]
MLILAVAFVSRLGLLIAIWDNGAAAVRPDSWSYMEPARNLLNTGAFWRGDPATGQPELLRTPGYPLFLLLCGLGQNYRYAFTRIAQVGLGVAVVFLTYLLGTGLVNPVVGLWAAALQSVSIGSILSSVWILSECLFSFLLALTLLLLVRHFQEADGPFRWRRRSPRQPRTFVPLGSCSFHWCSPCCSIARAHGRSRRSSP